MRTTADKNCFCHTCGKAYHYLGINQHRAAHRRKSEDCRITYTHGNTRTFKFSQHQQANDKLK